MPVTSLREIRSRAVGMFHASDSYAVLEEPMLIGPLMARGVFTGRASASSTGSVGLRRTYGLYSLESAPKIVISLWLSVSLDHVVLF